ncbi:MAG: hypothetical protein DRI73_11260 [Bacteroidetes bacterium]|nr:MAG: hypothetical protein DRI73_11260 [Bacteroidota bacterium]
MYRILSKVYDNIVSRELVIVLSSIGALLILTTFLMINRFYFDGSLVITDLMKTVGIFTGASVGFILERKYVGFSTNGHTVKKVIRFVIGIAGTLLLLSGLKLLLPSVDAFHFLRYALAGLWITWFFPLFGKRILLFP